jgi:uncharacterized protein with ATP-grasp and redox domains
MSRISNELERAISELDESIKSMKKAGKVLSEAYVRERGDNWREYDVHRIIESFLKED